MNCHNCGERLEKIVTDLPFKIESGSIIIIKKLPVMQCKNCSEYVIEDSVMERVDAILHKVDKAVELEIFSYAM
jgi:YgiT-type zinc finger domain-containing protein